MTALPASPDVDTELAPGRHDPVALAGGALGMTFVGGSVAVSGVLHGTPFLSAQSLRYAVASLVLLAFARAVGHRVHRPSGREWLWLGGVVATGMVLFNVALVQGSAHAEPAVLAVAVAAVPLVLAVGGAIADGGRPSRTVLMAAGLVTVGAALVQGLGRSDAVGLVWALVVLACEAGFTLLAVPVLRAHGPIGVSLHTTWLAAIAFGALGLVQEGPTAVLSLDSRALLAIGYLSVAVTAVAFVLWYRCVERVGAGTSGLLTGVAPVAAVAVGAAVSGAVPGPGVWAGTALVALGLVAGLGTTSRARRGGAAAGSRRR